MASPKTLTLKTAIATRSDRSSFEATTPNIKAKKRTSLPIVEAYADLVGRGGNIDAMLSSRQPDMNNVRTVYDSASKSRMLYYEEQFQYKANMVGGARERVQKESPIIAELKTNVIIKDEFTLVTDLSYQLAARYNRPESAILIQVDHSACIALGGTFDPCYILTVTAIPSQMGPRTNQRNATLIQHFMAEILSVPIDRGIVKFHAIEEHNYATNAVTIMAEIERAEKQQGETNGTHAPRSAAATNRKSLPSFRKSAVKLNEGMKSPMGAPVNNINGITDLPYVDRGRRSSVPETVVQAVQELYELPATNGDDSVPLPIRSNTHDSGIVVNLLTKEDVIGRDTRMLNGRPKTTTPKPFSPVTIPAPSQTPIVSVQDELMAAPSPKIYRNAWDKSRHNSSTTLGRRSIESVRPQAKPEPKVLSSLLEISSPQQQSAARRRSAQNLEPKSHLIAPGARINPNTQFKRSPSDMLSPPKRDAHMNEKMRLVDAKTLYGAKDAKPPAVVQRKSSVISDTQALPPLPIHQRMAKMPFTSIPPPSLTSQTENKEPTEKGNRRRSFLAALRRNKTAPVQASSGA